jgi:hypothetical protein
MTVQGSVGQAYLVEVSEMPFDSSSPLCEYVALTSQDYVTVQNSQGIHSVPFDYAQAGLIFSMFFSFTVGLWLFSKNLGLILQAVKRF